MKYYEKLERIITNELYEFVNEIRDEDGMTIELKLHISNFISSAVTNLQTVVEILKAEDL